MNDEEWRSVKDFEGIYEVSNFGRLRSLDRVNTFGGYKRTLKGRIIKPQKYPNGYLFYPLSKNGETKLMIAHRLVAYSFFGISDLEINHKDGDKENNHVSNLEYVSHSDNMFHSFRVLKRDPVCPYIGKRGFDHNKSQAVKITNTNTGEVLIYGSFRIANDNGFNRGLISSCAKNGRLYRNIYKVEKI